MNNTTQQPLVSVIIPNYNHSQFLEQRIESVLCQDFRSFELLILDDASTDNSVDIIKDYAKRYGFRYFINNNNSGSPFAQWLKGINLSNGKYIWIAESDDYADSAFLSKILLRLEDDPELMLGYCQSYYINDQSRIIGSALKWTDPIDVDRWKYDYINDGRLESLNYLSARNTIPNASAVVFRKSAFPANSDIANMKLCGDWITWGRIIRKGKIYFCAEHLNYFRVHQNTVRAKLELKLIDRECFNAARDNLLSFEIPIEYRNELGARLCRSWLGTVHPFSAYLFNYVFLLINLKIFSAINFALRMILRQIKIALRVILRQIKKYILNIKNLSP